MARPPPDGIRADALTDEEKRRVWRYIREHDQAFRAFLESPQLAAIRADLERRAPGAASVLIPWDTIRAALPAESTRRLLQQHEQRFTKRSNHR